MGSKLLKFALLVLMPVTGVAQTAADQAYEALRANDYDRAIAAFRQAIGQDVQTPQRADIRKDLAYTLLKIGETEAARDQFAEALRIDPNDDHAALEYAFLCFETKQPVLARRIFDRLRNDRLRNDRLGNDRLGNELLRKVPDAGVKATASEAFESVDKPLREGIERWRQALQQAPDNFSAHEELARLAEQRDDLALASEHYERAWRLRTDRRDLLLALARTWKANREEDANAALIAA
jgi:tetratricopeptide (TPR) repeat protein